MYLPPLHTVLALTASAARASIVPSRDEVAKLKKVALVDVAVDLFTTLVAVVLVVGSHNNGEGNAADATRSPRAMVNNSIVAIDARTSSRRMMR